MNSNCFKDNVISEHLEDSCTNWRPCKQICFWSASGTVYILQISDILYYHDQIYTSLKIIGYNEQIMYTYI